MTASSTASPVQLTLVGRHSAPEAPRRTASLPSRFSLRVQFTIFLSALVAALLAVGGVATLRLVMIEHAATAMNVKSLGGRNLLGDISRELSSFRMAEIGRHEAADARARLAFERSAQARSRAIEESLDRYLTLRGEASSASDLRSAIQDYLRAHDSWEATDAYGALDAPARAGGMLEAHYLKASDEARRLIARNNREAAAAGAHIERLVAATLYMVLGLSLLVLLLWAWLLVRIKRSLTDPLIAITRALSGLAAGEREARFPAVERPDEIGQMAQAFDVFRANALALEEAHEAVRLAQEKARALARYDPLTGLPNRRLFAMEVEEAGLDTWKPDSAAFIFLVSLDRFKRVNGNFGRVVGDAVLYEVSRRLRSEAPADAFVAHFGGDEFAVLASVPAGSAHEAATRIGDALISALVEPICAGKLNMSIDASVGAVRLEAVRSPENWLHAASIAVESAKREGGSRLRFFEPDMEAKLRDEASLENDLRAAISAEQIEPYYQPLVDLRDGRICAFELLSRWYHPARGYVSPEIFVPLAERSGLVAALTWSVLRKACEDARAWPDDCRLSLNISPLHLRDPQLTVRLLAILTQAGFSPQRLEVEVTESALVEDLPTARTILTSLQNLGVKVALDDFGTGYSSLHHLSALRFDKVKIDRSFILSMRRDSGSEKIVDAVLGLAKNLGLLTVAEGVEDRSTAALLARKGCEFGQGYHFGKAMSADAAAELLRGPPLMRRKAG